MALPDFEKYKYIMFVDASGDDGYKFKSTSSDGSSYSFVVSCFVTTPQELEYNKQILLDMKQAIFVKPEQELKSTALKRHKNADAVYAEMKNLHGFAYSLVTDKRILQTIPDNPGVKHLDIESYIKNDLSGATHVFPYIALQNSNILSENDKILIVIDNMKKREMDSIKNILAGAPKEQYDLIFRDSKDKNFPLIQIADIFAGTTRAYYENCLPLKTHNQYCKICFSSLRSKAGNSNLIGKCANKKIKKLYTPYVSDKRFNLVAHFHKSENNFADLGTRFIIVPFKQLEYFAYIECHIFKKRFWK